MSKLGQFLFILSLITAPLCHAQSDVNYRYDLLKIWFMDERHETQLQLENKETRIGMIINLGFGTPSVGDVETFIYSLDDINDRSIKNPFTDDELKVLLSEVVKRDQAKIIPVIYPRMYRYDNGATAMMVPSAMSPYFPMYIPTNLPRKSRETDAHYYEVLLKRLKVLPLQSPSACLPLFTI